jgi:transitional endoplasmic reticulum ATPase
MSRETSLKVGEARQRDAGRGKVRIDDKDMRTVGVVAGDVVELKGKRIAGAIAWPAYQEDQGKGLIRIDGLIRKNAGVLLSEFVTVGKAGVKEAKTIILAPVDIRLNMSKDFTNLVRSRIMETPLVEGDTVFITLYGSAIPFLVIGADPQGIVKITQATDLSVSQEPAKTEEAEAYSEDTVGRLGQRIRVLERSVTRMKEELERRKAVEAKKKGEEKRR